MRKILYKLTLWLIFFNPPPYFLDDYDNRGLSKWIWKYCVADPKLEGLIKTKLGVLVSRLATWLYKKSYKSRRM